MFLWPCTAWADIYIYASAVSLSWMGNPEADVRGYEVHRGNSYDGPYAKAHEGIIKDTFWTDTDVSTGSKYHYKLRAEDVCGNISGFSAPSEAIIVSDGDFDHDGYSDAFEQTMGTDPLAASSQPSAAILTLSPSQALLDVGESVQLNVVGIFEPRLGTPIEHDMTCLVGYRSDPPGIVSIDSCGNVVGQSEGITEVWAWQIINDQTVAASNPAMITVHGPPPYVDHLETHPYDGQGMNEDANGNGILDSGEDLDRDGVLDVDTGPTHRVPIDTGIVIRVVDNIGIDERSIQMIVNSVEVPVKVREINPGNTREIDVAYRNFDGFAFDEVVSVQLSLSDLAGNPMNYSESFQVESEAEHQWAREHMPVQTVTALGNETCELSATPMPDFIDDELLDGAKIIYDCNEPIEPRFGPVNELPHLDISTPAGTPMNLEPANVFDHAVKLIVPLPGIELEDTDHDGTPDAGLEAFKIYQYTAEPTALWRATADVPGWAVEGSRVDRYETVPPTIEINVNHFSGAEAGYGCKTPSADFSMSPTQIEVGEEVQFQDESIGKITTWFWDFGDGTTSTDQSPICAYDIPGVHTVTLTVTGPCGSDSKAKTIGVCSRIHLRAPADGTFVQNPPTFWWGPSCNKSFVLELSFEPDFGTILAKTPNLSGQSFPVPRAIWSFVPSYRMIYWRVRGENTNISPNRIHTSEEVWSFGKY